MNEQGKPPSSAPLLVGVALAGALTAMATGWGVRQAFVTEAGRDFAIVAQTTEKTINDQYLSYLGAVRAGQGMLALTPSPTEKQWRILYETLDLENLAVSFDGYAYVRRIPTASVAGYEKELARRAAKDPRIKGTLFPPCDREWHAPLTYIEPSDDRTVVAVGYDLASSEARLDAMIRASATGAVVATPPIRLVTVGSPSRAALLVAAGPEGYVALGLRAAGILDRVPPALTRNVLIDIADLGVGGDAPPVPFYEATPIPGHTPRFALVSDLPVGDRVWRIVYRSTPAYEATAIGRGETPTAAVTGLILLLTGALTWGLASTLRLREADRVKEEALATREARWRALVESAPEIIMNLTPDGDILFVNRPVGGRPPTELAGRPVTDLVPSEERIALKGDIVRARDNRAPVESEIRVVDRDDGERHAYSVRIGPIVDATDALVSLAVTARDVSHHKKMEKELRESEALYRMVVDNTTDMISHHDTEGRYLYVSPSVRRLLGYAPSELIGRSAYEFFHPDDLTAIQNSHLTVLERPTVFTVSYRIRMNNGQWRWVETTSRVFEGAGGGKEIVSSTRDIEGRVAAQRRSLEAERRFRETLENVRLMAVQLDARGTITFANNYLLDKTGWSREEALGRSWFDLFLPETDREKIRALFAALLTGDATTTHATNAIVNRDGTERVVAWSNTLLKDEYGEVTGTASVGNDITEEARAAAQLAASEERYRTVADFTYDWETWTSPDGDLIYTSPSCERVSGYPPEAFAADPALLIDIVHEDDRERVRRHFRHETLEDEPEGEMEFRVRHKDGRTIWVAHACQNVVSEEGRWLGRRASNRDVTQRKESEAHLHLARDEAEEAGRLKDKFVSLVAHDLRSPLSGMVGLLRTLLQRAEKEGDEKSAYLLGKVVETGDRMAETVDQLLDISRLKTGSIVPRPRFVDGHEIAALALAAMAPQAAAKGVALANDVPEGSRLYADPTLFGEVIKNLVNNGVKFCREGDRVRLFVPDDGVGIGVEDTGVGLATDDHANLFRLDVKTSRDGTAGEKGTGLGLPYSYDIMKAHGGDLTAAARPEKTVFTATVPFVRPRVLVTDDEAAVRFLVKEHLRRIEADCDEAGDGDEALRWMEERPPHLVILDLFMPGMDGFEALTRIKGEERYRNTPVIVLTADASEESREKAFRLGADDFVNKPIAPAEFLPRVRRFLI
jgi:PAS domain S-box-containing protein